MRKQPRRLGCQGENDDRRYRIWDGERHGGNVSIRSRFSAVFRLKFSAVSVATPPTVTVAVIQLRH